MFHYLILAAITLLFHFSNGQPQPIDISSGLTNFWSFNGDFNDTTGGADLFNCVNCSLTLDRFNNSNSALSLSSGYMQAPPGEYFGENFTITVWCNFRTFTDWERVLDFGNGAYSDNVILALWNDQNQVYGQAYNYNYTYDLTLSIQKIQLNVWYHVAFVLNAQYGYVYTNGVIISTNLLNQCNPVNRTSNFIGRSNWHAYGDLNADAIFDDIKIFNRSLNATEILNDYSFSNISPMLGVVWAPQPTPEVANDNTSAPFYYDYQVNNLGSLLNEINSTLYKYLDCYGDRPARDLDGIYIDNNQLNSPIKCAEVCSQYYFQYAGVQNAYQCWCGNTYNRYGRASNCFLECPGDSSLICGGQFANNVYQIINYTKLERAIACQNKWLKLECSNGFHINVKYAVYGRVSQRVCRFQNFNTDKCMSNMNDTMSVVKSKCELKQTCQFTVGEALFGNPCQGIYKYVDIKYECVQNDF